ncbi:MAG: PKD domain-containing protein [Cytophagales bacterium]|nr:PKD domain-containing protein [Cytophagales bacterium]
MSKKISFYLFFWSISLFAFSQNILDNQDYLKFIENKGQWDKPILFKTDIPNGVLFLEKNTLTYNFVDGEEYAATHQHGTGHEHSEEEHHLNKMHFHAFSVEFLNANAQTTVEGQNAYREKRNYFYGNTPSTNVQAYQKIDYKNIYEGTTLSIFQHGNSLKYEFRVEPHFRTKPKDIKLKYTGVDSLFVKNEELHIVTSLNEIVEAKPYAYQIIGGEKKEVKCRFVVKGDILSYKVGRYNKKFPLVIDPQLIFSTYSGSTADNWGNTACLDTEGNLYTGGTIFPSPTDGFPATLGAYQSDFQGGGTDIGILKFDSSGTNLLYATYIGGNDSEIPTSLIANDKQELYILAMTGSDNFPTSENAYQKEFKKDTSNGKWLVNGQVVSTDINSFSSSTLKDGDQVQFIFDNQYCNNRTYTVDSSNVITISTNKKLRAEITGSHKNFCAGDNITFSVTHNSNQPEYSWFVNNQSVNNNTPSFTTNTLNDQDIVTCIISDAICNEQVTSNEWQVNEVTGQNLSTIPFIREPETICSSSFISLEIDDKLIGNTSTIIWRNKQDTIPLPNNTFILSGTSSLNDTLFAIINSSLSCLSNTGLFSDTIIVDNSQQLSSSVEWQTESIDRCTGAISLSLSTNNIGAGSSYSWYYENDLIGTSINPFFRYNNAQEGSYKVIIDNNLGCIDTAQTTHERIFRLKLPFEITSSEDSICVGETIDFTTNIALINEQLSIDPFVTNTGRSGGYAFNQGTDFAIIHLNAKGDSLLASTLLGGNDDDGVLERFSLLNNNYGDILRGDINIDSLGNVYVASVTKSVDFPIVNGAQADFGGGNTDGVAFKFSSDLSTLLWSTYIGGVNDDALYSIQRDSENNVYVAGGALSDSLGTDSTYSPQLNGDVDAFVSHIKNDGSEFLHNTYFGTSSYDQAYFVQLDDDNEVYILGQTKGELPLLPNNSVYHQERAGLFVTKFDSTLSNIIFSTTIGDTISTDAIIPNISPTAFLVNECENLFIAGWGGLTNSSRGGYNGGFTFNLPVTENAFQTTSDGSDFYMMAIQKDLNQLLYATYFGGQLSAEHVDGGTSRFDEKGIVYQSVCAGCGGFNDFPIFPAEDNDPNTYPKSHGRSGIDGCNNGVIKFDLALLEARMEIEIACDNQLLLKNQSVGGIDYTWDFGDGNSRFREDTTQFFYQYDSAGTYTIRLVAKDITTCTAFDTTAQIAIVPSQLSQNQQDTICAEESITLIPTQKEGATYEWFPTDYLASNNASQATITPTSNYSYVVSITDTNGCIQRDTLAIEVIPQLKAGIKFDINCDNPEELGIINSSLNGINFTWNFGDGTASQTTQDTSQFIHQYDTTGIYTVQLIAQDTSTCTAVDTISQQVLIPSLISQNQRDSICLGSSITLVPTQKEGATYEWIPTGYLDSSNVMQATINPTSDYVYIVSITDTNECVQRDTLVVQVKDFQPNIGAQIIGSCSNFPTVLFNDSTRLYLNHVWDFGDGTISTDPQPQYLYDKYGTYNISVEVSDNQCVFRDTAQITIDPLYVPNIVTPNKDDRNEEFIISGIENNGDWKLEVYNRWGKEIYLNDEYDNTWTGEDLEDGTYYYLLTAPDETTCKGWIYIVR